MTQVISGKASLKTDAARDGAWFLPKRQPAPQLSRTAA